jgi:hypothetical protein
MLEMRLIDDDIKDVGGDNVFPFYGCLNREWEYIMKKVKKSIWRHVSWNVKFPVNNDMRMSVMSLNYRFPSSEK